MYHTSEIWRPFLQTSSVKVICWLCSTGNIGVKSSVQSWTQKIVTKGSIILISSITINEQVSEYIYFGFTYTHLTALLIGWFFILCISYFNDDYMHLNISCNYYAFYAYHINILHYLPLWNQTFPGRKSWQGSSWFCLSMVRLCQHKILTLPKLKLWKRNLYASY